MSFVDGILFFFRLLGLDNKRILVVLLEGVKVIICLGIEYEVLLV